jgi:XTP/dITP diphosphohydrolase
MEKNMDIVLSTRNPTKASQIKALFEGTAIRVLTLDDAGIGGEAVENGETLEENSFKKARFVQDHAPGMWSMADDTGLFIKALKGEPGVYAARWAGEGAATADITAYCLKRLEGVADRSATFKTVVAVVAPDLSERFFVGEVGGRILDLARGPAQPKMPYSPLFVPNGYDKCWSEMTVEEENRISHRGIAFTKAKEALLAQILQGRL